MKAELLRGLAIQSVPEASLAFPCLNDALKHANNQLQSHPDASVSMMVNNVVVTVTPRSITYTHKDSAYWIHFVANNPLEQARFIEDKARSDENPGRLN